jgi:uncharacterized membrane protein
MKKISIILSALLFSLFVPQNTFAQALNPGQFQGTVATLTQYINVAIGLIIGIAVLVFIFGLVKYVTAGGDPEQLKAARNTIIMGVIVIAVMVTVWGLIKFVVGVSGLDTQAIPSDQLPRAPVPQL